MSEFWLWTTCDQKTVHHISHFLFTFFCLLDSLHFSSHILPLSWWGSSLPETGRCSSHGCPCPESIRFQVFGNTMVLCDFGRRSWKDRFKFNETVGISLPLLPSKILMLLRHKFHEYVAQNVDDIVAIMSRGIITTPGVPINNKVRQESMKCFQVSPFHAHHPSLLSKVMNIHFISQHCSEAKVPFILYLCHQIA